MEFLNELQDIALASWVRESPSLWAYPLIIFFHSLGLSIAVGASVVIDLVVLGFAPGLELSGMKKLFPILALGFWINAVSGMLLAIADASTMFINPLFWIKMGLIALAVADVLLVKRKVFGGGQLLTSPGRLPSAVTALAVASLVLWTAAITAGRLTAYLGANPGTVDF
jgi:hypothetical protein